MRKLFILLVTAIILISSTSSVFAAENAAAADSRTANAVTTSAKFKIVLSDYFGLTVDQSVAKLKNDYPQVKFEEIEDVWNAAVRLQAIYNDDYENYVIIDVYPELYREIRFDNDEPKFFDIYFTDVLPKTVSHKDFVNILDNYDLKYYKREYNGSTDYWESNQNVYKIIVYDVVLKDFESGDYLACEYEWSYNAESGYQSLNDKITTASWGYPALRKFSEIPNLSSISNVSIIGAEEEQLDKTLSALFKIEDYWDADSVGTSISYNSIHVLMTNCNIESFPFINYEFELFFWDYPEFWLTHAPHNFEGMPTFLSEEEISVYNHVPIDDLQYLYVNDYKYVYRYAPAINEYVLVWVTSKFDASEIPAIPDTECDHTLSTYGSDVHVHWNICKTCGFTWNVEEHSFVDDICSKCDYEKTEPASSGDMNSDGEITLDDAIEILKIAMKVNS